MGSVVLDTGRGFVTGMAAVCQELLQLLALTHSLTYLLTYLITYSLTYLLVCQELLQLLACDVVLLGVVHTNAKGQPFLSLIGRCSARAEGQAVDLNTVLSRWVRTYLLTYLLACLLTYLLTYLPSLAGGCGTPSPNCLNN